MDQRKRVVVTGMGTINPLGHDVKQFWEGLTAGRSAIGRITKFDPEDFNCQVAGEIRDFDFSQHFTPKDMRKLDGFTHLAVIAARQAAEQSGILESGLSRDLIGCIMGVGIGGIGYIQEQVQTMTKKGPRRVSPMFIPKSITNIAPGQISIFMDLRGPTLSIVTACAAGTHAIGESAAMIRRGDAVAILAGGTEAAICEVAVAGFTNMQALSTGFNDCPAEASRPFDARRTGFVIGEGAGMLVLEDYEHAKARGVPILAEVVGYGLSTDAYHIVAPAPDGSGGARAMAGAIRNAGLEPKDIGYINAHGTGTPLNDKCETMAIKTVFGEHAPQVPISSTKSMIGHLLGAAGAVEAVATIMTIREGTIPPTINLTDPDPECDLDYVPNTARQAQVDYAMSNSLGFGGHNCSLVFGRNSS